MHKVPHTAICNMTINADIFFFRSWRKIMGRCGLDWSGSEKEEVVGCCEHVITIRTALHAGYFLTSLGNVSFSEMTTPSANSEKHLHVFVVFCVKLSRCHGGRCSGVSGGSHVNLRPWFWRKHVRLKRRNNFFNPHDMQNAERCEVSRANNDITNKVYLLYYVCTAVFYFRCRTAG